MHTESPELPIAFCQRMEAQLGEEYQSFIKSLSDSPATSIRLNPNKITEAFRDNPEIPWCPLGRFLDQRPSFTHDPLLHAGAYYVQEASSMFLWHVLQSSLDLAQDYRVLDLSAAPGGKTTLLQSMLSPNSLILANEIIGSRNKVLRQNVSRWGMDNIWVSQNDPGAFQKVPHAFDIMLIDAPCSGEGLFRKDPNSRSTWSPDHVNHCAARQKRILGDSLPALVPGGLLIYSTCTFSEMENERNLDWLIQEYDLEPVTIPVPAEFGISTGSADLPAYRFYPHRGPGEGFFLGILRKPGEKMEPNSGKRRKPKYTAWKPASPEDNRWLKDGERYRFLDRADHHIALPEVFLDDYYSFSQNLHLTLSGLNTGKIYHGELKPSPELALSTALNPEVPHLELSRSQCLNYLSHESIQDLPEGKAGRSLVTYEGLGLGWINRLKTGQIKNNYPSAWRILKRENPSKG